MEPIKVFVGTVRETWLPFKVLQYSILRRTKSPCLVVELYKFDHLIPEKWRQKAATPFSFQRFLIPEVCEHQGRGIYLDSDMLLRADIRELWDHPFPDGKKILTPRKSLENPGWQTSVLLYDCTIPLYISNKQERKKSHISVSMNMRGISELSRSLDPMWNCMDRPKLKEISRPDAKLIHFTTVSPTFQPWIYANHPCGTLWTNELMSALEHKHISEDELRHEIGSGFVRPSLALLIGWDQQQSDKEWFEYTKKYRKEFYRYPE